jgi:dolichol-phosphate mannosyltransferase
MVMASTQVREEEAQISVNSPLLSIVMPVYNGSKKIETTIQILKDKIEKLRFVVASLEGHDGNQERSLDYAVKNDSPTSFFNKTEGARYYQDSSYSTNSGLPWYEIIVVNDGSMDDTKNILSRISSLDETIRLISYSINMGKGYAIKQGVLHSRGKYVMFMDGDGEISAEVLSKYLERMATADIVIASKYHPLSVVNVPMSRRFLSKCFHFFVKLMIGIKVSDTQVGLKVGNGDRFRKIFQRVMVKRYAFDAEMLAVAGIMGLKVDELPVKIDLDKSFKKKEIVKMALDILGVAFRLRVVKWYQNNMEKQRPYYRAFTFT